MSRIILCDETLRAEWAARCLADRGSFEAFVSSFSPYECLPARLYGRDPELLGRFIAHMEEEHFFQPDEYWFVGILDATGENITRKVEHPTWADLASIGITKPVKT